MATQAEQLRPAPAPVNQQENRATNPPGHLRPVPPVPGEVRHVLPAPQQRGEGQRVLVPAPAEGQHPVEVNPPAPRVENIAPQAPVLPNLVIGVGVERHAAQEIQKGTHEVRNLDVARMMGNETRRDRIINNPVLRIYQWPIAGNVVRGLMHPLQTLHYMGSNYYQLQDRRFSARLQDQVHAAIDPSGRMPVEISQQFMEQMIRQGREAARGRPWYIRARRRVGDTLREVTGVGQTSARREAIARAGALTEPERQQITRESLNRQIFLGRRIADAAMIPAQADGSDLEMSRQFLGLTSLRRIQGNQELKDTIWRFARMRRDAGAPLTEQQQIQLMQEANRRLIGLVPQNELYNRQISSSVLDLVNTVATNWDGFSRIDRDGRNYFQTRDLTIYYGQPEETPRFPAEEGLFGNMARAHADRLAERRFRLGRNDIGGRAGTAFAYGMEFARGFTPYAAAVGLDLSLFMGKSVAKKFTLGLSVGAFAAYKSGKTTGEQSREAGITVSEGRGVGSQLAETLATGAMARDLARGLQTRIAAGLTGENADRNAKTLLWELSQVEARYRYVSRLRRAELIRYSSKANKQSEETSLRAAMLLARLRLDEYYRGRGETFNNTTYNDYVHLAMAQLYSTSAEEQTRLFGYINRGRLQINRNDVNRILALRTDADLRRVAINGERLVRTANNNLRNLQARRAASGALQAMLGMALLTEVANPAEGLDAIMHTSAQQAVEEVEQGVTSAIHEIPQIPHEAAQAIEQAPHVAQEIGAGAVQVGESVAQGAGAAAEYLYTHSGTEIVAGAYNSTEHFLNQVGVALHGDASHLDITTVNGHAQLANPITTAVLAISDRFASPHPIEMNIMGHEVPIYASGGLHDISYHGHHLFYDSQTNTTIEYTRGTIDNNGNITLYGPDGAHQLQDIHITPQGAESIVPIGTHIDKHIDVDGHHIDSRVPVGTEWQSDGKGGWDLIRTSNHQVLIHGAKFDSQGNITNAGDYDKGTLSFSAEPHHGNGGFTPVNGRSNDSESFWNTKSSHIGHRVVDQTQGNDYLRMYNHIIRKHGEPVGIEFNVQNVIDINGTHANVLYWSDPQHPDHGYLLPVNADGTVKIDKYANADAWAALINARAIPADLQGNTEFYGHPEIFYLGGGTITAGWMDNQHVLHELASIHGTGSVHDAIPNSTTNFMPVVTERQGVLTGINLEDRLGTDPNTLFPVAFRQPYRNASNADVIAEARIENPDNNPPANPGQGNAPAVVNVPIVVPRDNRQPVPVIDDEVEQVAAIVRPRGANPVRVIRGDNLDHELLANANEPVEDQRRRYLEVRPQAIGLIQADMRRLNPRQFRDAYGEDKPDNTSDAISELYRKISAKEYLYAKAVVAELIAVNGLSDEDRDNIVEVLEDSMSFGHRSEEELRRELAQHNLSAEQQQRYLRILMGIWARLDSRDQAAVTEEISARMQDELGWESGPAAAVEIDDSVNADLEENPEEILQAEKVFNSVEELELEISRLEAEVRRNRDRIMAALPIEIELEKRRRERSDMVALGLNEAPAETELRHAYFDYLDARLIDLQNDYGNEDLTEEEFRAKWNLKFRDIEQSVRRGRLHELLQGGYILQLIPTAESNPILARRLTDIYLDLIGRRIDDNNKNGITREEEYDRFYQGFTHRRRDLREILTVIAPHLRQVPGESLNNALNRIKDLIRKQLADRKMPFKVSENIFIQLYREYYGGAQYRLREELINLARVWDGVPPARNYRQRLDFRFDPNGDSELQEENTFSDTQQHQLVRDDENGTPSSPHGAITEADQTIASIADLDTNSQADSLNSIDALNAGASLPANPKKRRGFGEFVRGLFGPKGEQEETSNNATGTLNPLQSTGDLDEFDDSGKFKTPPTMPIIGAPISIPGEGLHAMPFDLDTGPVETPDHQSRAIGVELEGQRNLDSAEWDDIVLREEGNIDRGGLIETIRSRVGINDNNLYFAVMPINVFLAAMRNGNIGGESGEYKTPILGSKTQHHWWGDSLNVSLKTWIHPDAGDRLILVTVPRMSFPGMRPGVDNGVNGTHMFSTTEQVPVNSVADVLEIDESADEGILVRKLKGFEDQTSKHSV